MPEVLTQGKNPGEYIIQEMQGAYSRDQGVLKSGENLNAGAVLAQEPAAGGLATAQADSNNTGDGAMGAITVSAGAVEGFYVLTIIEPATDAGSFAVEDPSGAVIGTGNVAAAFSAGGIAFTLADGATDFAAGDRIVIDVDLVSGGEYVEFDSATLPGLPPVAILYANTDASTAAKDIAVTSRSAEVDGGALEWFSGATAEQIREASALLADGPRIVVR